MRENEKNRLDLKEINSYRELMQFVKEEYKDDIAYKYKKGKNKEEPQYEEKTFTQYYNDVKAFATGLLELGLNKKKIIVIGNNSYQWVCTYMAVTTGGMIIVPLDKALPVNEIEALVIRSEAEGIVFDKKYEEAILKIKKNNTNALKYLICTQEPINKAEVLDYSQILENGRKLLKNGDTKYDKIKIDNQAMSIMLFTSGTTSLPKAVMLSQKNICSNLVAIKDWVKLYRTDTLLSFLPIHHTFECTITFLYGLYAGATVAFCDGLKYIAKNLKEYKITVFVAVPLVLETMYKKIQKGIEDKGKTKLVNKMSKVSNALLKHHIDLRGIIFKQIRNEFGGHLRVVLYGSAPMNKDTIIGYNNLGIDLVQGYGLTETSPVISAETDSRKRPGSVGLPLKNLQVKIEEKDKDGVGEIVVKGPSIMKGYFENTEATEKVLKDGWFYTGDYGYIDNDGFLYVTGRKSDVIVLKNGKNIYPQELEFLINKISYVTESLVYSREKNSTDTLLGAKIIYNKELIEEMLGKKTIEEYKEIIWNKIKEMNKSLPAYKHIKEIIITDEPLDKTTTQKVKRYQEIKKVENVK